MEGSAPAVPPPATAVPAGAPPCAGTPAAAAGIVGEVVEAGAGRAAAGFDVLGAPTSPVHESRPIPHAHRKPLETGPLETGPLETGRDARAGTSR